MGHNTFTHILITGASSGIGEAIALSYAAPHITLSLSGRDETRLAAVGAACSARGANVVTAALDVTDRESMSAWITARDQTLAIDLLVANAGVSGGTGARGENSDMTRRIFAINVDGVFNTVLPAIELFRARRRGHIAIVSSLAGFRGMGGAPAYCASKAAVRVWGEGLRAALARDNINVSVICPGFVVSRMTDVNKFPMPFLMSAEKAARIIQRGLAANEGRIAFPWPMRFAMWILTLLPDGLAHVSTRGLPAKD